MTSHIPDHLIRDFDFYNLPGMVDGTTPEVHELWKRVQDNYPDIFWTPHYGGHWIVTRFPEIERLCSDYESFSSRKVFLPDGIMPFLTPVQLDPPEHGKYRRLMMPAFTPPSLARASERARGTAVEVIERIAEEGKCEFTEDFAGIMPVVTFLSLVDLPESDAPYLHGLARRMSSLKGDTAAAAWAELSVYVQAQIDERRKSPPDDFIGSLIKAKIDGRPLSDEELFSMCILTVSGGLDTVAHMTSFAACFLAKNPDHCRHLIDEPDLLDNAVEEITRRFGTSNLGRIAVADTELDGQQIREGDMVVGIFPLAGLDDRVHDNPMSVDWRRKKTRNLAFGTGAHTCIGNRLAKRELRIFLEEWLKRIPGFHITEGTEPVMRSGLINLLRELHITIN